MTPPIVHIDARETSAPRTPRRGTENLEALLREERRNEGEFSPLPFHYVEIASLLLKK